MERDPMLETGVIRSAILDDDLSFFETLLTRPDLIADDIVIVADGRTWGGTTAGWPLAVAWRRGHGPVVLGLATGAATDTLFAGTLHLAGAGAAWDVAEWDERVRGWWEDVAPEVRARVEERWGLSAEEPWSVGAWTRAAWGEEPATGRPAVGIVATRLSDSVRAAIAWLAEKDTAVAYAIRWYGADASPLPRLDLVEGAWRAAETAPAQATSAPAPIATASRPTPPARPEPPPSPPPAADIPVLAETANPPAETVDTTDPAAATDIVAALEAIARETGAAVSRAGDWVRIDGAHRSLRVFPSSEWADLQLVGLDEGTLVGLRYRHGVPLKLESVEGAPPGVHLRIHGQELGPAVEALIRTWLEPPAQGSPPSKGRGAGSPRAPRNAGRRR